jgi:hypothetical protein
MHEAMSMFIDVPATMIWSEVHTLTDAPVPPSLR